MPTLESIDYERFSYGDSATPPITLDEAVKQSIELRRSDPSNFYRIESVDPNTNTFRIEKVPVASVYADFVARVAKSMARYSRTAGKL